MQDTPYSETEEKIFLAALDEFGKSGRQGARMQEIADRAGINKALIHYYFRSKDRLYEEVFSFVVRRFFLRIGESIRPGESFEDMLRQFIDNFLSLLERNPSLPSFILRDLAEGAPMLTEKVRDILIPHARSVPRVFIENFNIAVERGEIRALDPMQTLITILGSCIYFFAGFPILSAVLPKLKKQRLRFLQERRQHVFDIIYYGLKPRPEVNE